MECSKRDQMWLKMLSSFPAFSWYPPRLKKSKYFSRYGRSKLADRYKKLVAGTPDFWPFITGKGQKSDPGEKNTKIIFSEGFQNTSKCVCMHPLGSPDGSARSGMKKFAFLKKLWPFFWKNWPKLALKSPKNPKILALRNKNQKLWPPPYLGRENPNKDRKYMQNAFQIELNPMR